MGTALKGDKMLYKHEGQIYNYSPLQIEQGFAKGVPLTDEEIEEWETKQNEVPEPTIQDKINDAQNFLDSTDYKATKYAEFGKLLSEEEPEVSKKRQEVRDEINRLRKQLEEPINED